MAEKADAILDKFLDTGLGIAKDRYGRPTETASPRESLGPAPTAKPTDWKQIGLIGGAVVAVLVVLVMLFRR